MFKVSATSVDARMQTLVKAGDQLNPHLWKLKCLQISWI